MFLKTAKIPFLVLIAVALIYSPALFNGFAQVDDPVHLLDNPSVRSLSPENIKTIFHDVVNSTYIPLTTLSFAFEHFFFGYDPFVFHLNNLLLHLAVVLLVFMFFRQLGLDAVSAGIGAFFFGVHPMRVESVAWITERKDVLYAFFYMLSVIQYMRYLKTSSRQYYWISVGAGFLSILAKPMALSLPLVILLCDWWKGRGFSRAVIVEKWLYFVTVVPIAAITYMYHVRIPWRSLGEAVMLWTWCFVFYIRQFLFPGESLIFYQFPRPLSWQNPEYLLSGLAFVSIAGAGIYFRRHKIFVFALLFYFLSIFFLLRFDDLEHVSPVSDRFMYLPGAGFCALLGICFGGMLRPAEAKPVYRSWVAVALIVWMAFLSVRTFVQARLWHDPAQLWSAVIRRSPDLALAYVYRGAEYAQQGQIDAAAADYRKAIELKNDPFARSNLAMIYRNAGRYQDAIAEYTRSIEITPSFWGAYFHRGNLYKEIGEYQLAVRDYSTVLGILPSYAEAYTKRGTAYYLSGESEYALEDFNKALRFDPRSIEATNNRAVIFAKRGESDKAIFDFSRLIKLDPDNPAGYFNRGMVHKGKGDLDRAVQDFERALALDPGYREAFLRKQEILKHRAVPYTERSPAYE